MGPKPFEKDKQWYNPGLQNHEGFDKQLQRIYDSLGADNSRLKTELDALRQELAYLRQK